MRGNKVPQFRITSTIQFEFEGEFANEAEAEKFANNYDNLNYSMPVELDIEELEEDEEEEDE